MIHRIVRVNGIYNICCALSILRFVNIQILGSIHLDVFRDHNSAYNPRFERFLAYWIFTYGAIRLSGNTALIPFSYYVEAGAFAFEIAYGSVYRSRAAFIVATSLAIGYTYQCNSE